ncbi:hypothetical protein [Flavobacterium alvei]|uniref:hypothetical protein n=1 Tax=Flavobacterium alvei TaxID=2080416 RepID=UPI0026ED65E1|nr:hypothetical protein [Flavobacterium alvei]
MEGNVTVNQALNRGRWQLKYLPMIVTFGFIIGCFFLVEYTFLGGFIIPIGFILGFSMGWLVWSYYVMEWKIWAYENVRNIHELQRKAVEEKLIWETGSWFEKTEFKNYQQKQKLNQLEKKFLEKDVYKDDISVPKETIIYYSRKTILLMLVVFLGLGFFGVFLLFEKEYLGLLFLGIGIYFSFDQAKKLRDKNPQIVLNDKGIKLKNENLVSWNKIFNDRVFSESKGKSSTNYLAFNAEKIAIDELTIEYEELENLLHVYRVRYEKYNY